MNTKGSELKIFSSIVSAAVYLSTKSILVMKRKFYATNTAKMGLVKVPLLHAVAKSDQLELAYRWRVREVYGFLKQPFSFPFHWSFYCGGAGWTTSMASY